MKIVGATVLEYVRKLDGRSWNPVSRWTERRAPLLLLHVDNGLTGVGEAWSKQDEIVRVLDLLALRVVPAITGIKIRGPDDIVRISDTYRDEIAGALEWVLPAAVSALDIAMWDLLAKSQQRPLWNALGGMSGNGRVYASGGLYRDGTGLDELAAEVRGYIGKGFRDVKMKVGALPLTQELQRVRAVREAMGVAGRLWVDALNRLDPSTAVRDAAALRDAGASAIQAPVAFDDIQAMVRINAKALPVVAGETDWQPGRYAELAASKAVSFVQLNLGLCGGFSGAQRSARAMHSGVVPFTLQTHGTAVLQSAALHFGAATAAVDCSEFHCFHNHLGWLLEGHTVIDDGRMVVDDEPGLGIGTPQPGAQRDGGEIRRHCPFPDC
ncbi:MAG: enolase C-terminal domain-like protein [Casimicrobiaceae bacterium]